MNYFNYHETWKCSNCGAKITEITCMTHGLDENDIVCTSNKAGRAHRCHTGKDVFGALQFESVYVEDQNGNEVKIEEVGNEVKALF